MVSKIHLVLIYVVDRAHNASVQGLCTDALNRHLISVSLDGVVKVPIVIVNVKFFSDLGFQDTATSTKD